MILTCDCWGIPEKESIENPSWENVENMIDSMDGTQIDGVYLGKSEGDYLMIGSGEDGIYIGVVMEGDKCYQCWDENKPDETMEINVGGQPGDYPRKMQFDKVAIKDVAKYYYLNLKRHPQYYWKLD